MASEQQKWSVGSLLSASSAFWQANTIHAAVRLDVFSHLGDEALTSEEIASRIKGSKRGVPLFLNALVALGLLGKKNGSFVNTDFSRIFLSRDSKKYMGYIILHHHHLVDGWAQLDQAVLTGEPVDTRSYGEESERKCFLMGMYNLAMGLAPEWSGKIDLAGRRHLLDLGGGPGVYAIHFCLANPHLRATIYDRPTSRPFALETIEKFGLQDRIDFQGGDFTDDFSDGRFDAAWLSHILHSNGPETCRHILEKTVSVMDKGGQLMIHEFFLNDTMDGPKFPALFSLNMLINNSEGRSYSEAEITDMMADVGLKDIHALPFKGPNDSYVLCGTV